MGNNGCAKSLVKWDFQLSRGVPPFFQELHQRLTVHKVLGGGIPLESLSFGFTGLGLFFEL